MAGVELETAEELTGFGGDDANIAVGDKHRDRGAGVFSADTDLVEAGVVAEGDNPLAEERTGTHFMGAVVLQQHPTASAEIENQSVIDGQQWPTTAQILMDAAQEVFEELDRNPQTAG